MYSILKEACQYAAGIAGVLRVAAERVHALRQGLNAALDRGEVPPPLVASQEGGRPGGEAHQPRGFRERLAPFVGGGPGSNPGPQVCCSACLLGTGFHFVFNIWIRYFSLWIYDVPLTWIPVCCGRLCFLRMRGPAP